jgi:twinkle protein
LGFGCHYAFGLERNQQAEDLVTRLTTIFRCVKDRYTGQANGETFLLRYDRETGMLDEADPVAPNGEAHGFTDETTNGENTNSDF